jgi:hypothetical protein
VSSGKGKARIKPVRHDATTDSILSFFRHATRFERRTAARLGHAHAPLPGTIAARFARPESVDRASRIAGRNVKDES